MFHAMFHAMFHRVIKCLRMAFPPGHQVTTDQLIESLQEQNRLLQEQNKFLKERQSAYDKGRGEFVLPSAQCYICLEGFECKLDRALTHCNHTYHDRCLKEWLDNHDNCPVCRQSIDKYFLYPLSSFVKM